MKICGKCGAHQSDDRSTCLDCGAVLGKPLSESEERELNEDISDALYGMSERTEDFYVSPLDRVLGIVSIVLAAAMVILLSYCGSRLSALDNALPEGTVRQGEYFAVYNPSNDSWGMTNVHPNAGAIQAYEKPVVYALIALVCLIVSALELLIPKIMWFLGTLRYRLWFAGDHEPSDWYLITTKIFKYGIFAVGVLCSAAALLYLF